MKSVSKSRRLRARAVSIAACIALLLCTVLSFCFINTKPVKSSAEEERVSETGIRFVQVAAGEDFAIGLTYDGRLFGWSLLDEGYGQEPSSAQTLGEYYTKTPREIPVIFRSGPGSQPAQVRWNSSTYHNAVAPSASNQATIIKEIVATRTTAAFITNNGTIYTWGKDILDINGYGNEKPNYLLLRTTEADGNTSPLWYLPYIIDYGFYAEDTGSIPAEFQFIRPALDNPTIAAGEYNYIISFGKSNNYYTYSWGSMMYSVRMDTKMNPNTKNDYQTGMGGDKTSDNRVVFRTAYSVNDNTSVRAVAGGYTVGINGITQQEPKSGATSLSLRGKNFVSSVSALKHKSDADYDISRTAATQSREYTFRTNDGQQTAIADGTSVTTYDLGGGNSINVNGAVIGNYVSSANNGGIISGVEEDAADLGDLFMGRLASGKEPSSAAIKFTTSNDARTNTVYSAQANAAGDPIALINSASTSYSKPLYYDVSLGYDVGYAIAGGKLYSWGDDTYGQSGRETGEMPTVTVNETSVQKYTYSAGGSGDENVGWSYPKTISFTSSDTIISVAAGKQMSTKTPTQSDKAFNSATTFTGNAGSYALHNSVVNDGSIPYITGALTAKGEIVAWNYETRKTSDNVQRLTYGGVKLNAKDKFGAVYSGYGNHLFAVTALGKLVHISYDSAENKFVQEIYDDFVVAKLPTSGNQGQINYAEAGNFKIVKTENNGENRIGDPESIEYSKLVNWTKSSDTDNPVIFTVDGEENEPELGDMIIYLDNLMVSQKTIELYENPTSDAQVASGLLYGGSRGSLVNGNGIGDVYRILDPDKGNVSFIDTTGTGTREKDELTAADLKLKFKLVGSDEYMSDTQIGFMFDYDVVYSSEFGVGIKIDPKQSSQGLWVVVEFYIARYDSRANFRITNSDPLGSERAGVTDTAVYYDYQPSSFRFKIDNTVAYRNQNAFETIENPNDGNSYIPLLDPNNEYNSVYSVAVQDVSGGVNALTKYLTGAGNVYDDGVAGPENFVNAIVDAMKLADRVDGMAEGNTAFPAVSRIDAGNLEYYFGSSEGARKYYSDKYQYLLKDRDADVLILNTGAVSQVEMLNANKDAVSASRFTVRIVNLDISEYGVSSDAVDKLATEFNNKYGLYNIRVADGKLSFNYDIIRFTAKGATGSLSYEDNDITKVKTVRGNAYEQINVTATEYSIFDAATYTPVMTGNVSTTSVNIPNAFAVFSQPSLRLKASATPNASGVVYGKHDENGATDTYTETISTLRVGDTWTRSLSHYIENAGAKLGAAGVTSESSAIYFSAVADRKGEDGKPTGETYENHTDFSKFNNGFHDETNSGEKIVTLTADSITVKPTTAHPINFRVTIRRFHSSQNASTFGDNEKITIVFNFVTVSDFTFVSSGGKTSYAVDKQTSCNILGGAGSLIEKLVTINPASYESKIRIGTPRSSNLSVLTVNKTGDTTFDVVPVSSGRSVVQVVATVYDKSVVITLEFNVSGLTSIADKVNLIDTSYVYVNSLIGDLREANSFNTRINNYGVLFEDVDQETGKPNAVYFTDASGVPIDGYPSFVKAVRFTHYSAGSNNPRIAIDFDGDSRETSGEYYMHVRYVDTTNGYSTYADAEAASDTILETRQSVSSAKHIVPGDNGEAIFTVDVDCDKSKEMNMSNPKDDWYTRGVNTDMTIYIPIKMLMSKVGKPTPENYAIFLVTSTTEAANYFNYSFDNSGNVLIHPLYDTPEPITVNVSVRSTDAESQEASQVVSFRVKTTGISTTLSKHDYTTIWLVAFFASFGVLFIIFLIRMIVYWRRRAKQRALIKRNQELIKMRDRVHNKASAATREQLVRSKMKMEDPKYAKLFNEMKKDRQAAATGGVTLESMSAPAEVDGGKKGKKKKNGKKSIAELKAELEAKKAAFAQAQNGDAPAPPFGAGAPQGDFASPDFGGQNMGGFDPAQNFGSPTDAFSAQDLDANSIIFDVADDNGAQG